MYFICTQKKLQIFAHPIIIYYKRNRECIFFFKSKSNRPSVGDNSLYFQGYSAVFDKVISFHLEKYIDWVWLCTDKKNFLAYNDIQTGAVAKSYTV
jgi:hypothetical protein